MCSVESDFLQIEEFDFEQAEEIFRYSIVRTVALSTHALLDAFLSKHLLVLLVLLLTALTGSCNHFLKLWCVSFV